MQSHLTRLTPRMRCAKPARLGTQNTRRRPGKFQRSAETELETCYHRKPLDEFTGLAGADPLWLETLANSWRKD